MVWIGLGLGLCLACLTDYNDLEWTGKENVRVIRKQKEFIEDLQKKLPEGQRITAVKPPRIEHFRSGLFLLMLLSVFFVLVTNASVIYLATASEEKVVTVITRTGYKLRESVDIYILVRIPILILSSSFIFSFILFFARNKVPYTLIFTPFQLILYEKYINENTEVSRKMIPINWDKVNYASTAAYDYFTIHYTDESGTNHEHIFYHSEVGLSESKFGKIFRKYGVKVEVCGYL